MTTRPNILLITVDTLRADHLGCYRYHRPTSPYIDAIAAEGALCENFFCSAIPTQPSYTTLYTGQHPIRHGIISQGGDAVLSSAAPFLSEMFLEAGYTTCALDTLLRDRMWFGRGYEFYIDPALRRTLRLNVSCDELNARAIPWLRTHAHEQFFLFLHYWDPHAPYIPPDRYRHLFYQGNPTDPANRSLEAWWQHPLGSLARETWLRTEQGVITDADYVTALYDQEVRHVDDGIGELVGTLDELGLSDTTLVVILADHGESLTEHGIFYEHHGLYEPTLRVPLIVRWPGQIGRNTRISQMVQMHDIAPTLLEAAGLPIPSVMDGQSFWRILTDEAETGGRDVVISLECTLQAKWSLRTAEYKFILARHPDFYGNPTRELYHLSEDPNEERNIAADAPEITSALEKRLEDWIRDHLADLGKDEDPVREQGISLLAVMEAG